MNRVIVPGLACLAMLLAGEVSRASETVLVLSSQEPHYLAVAEGFKNSFTGAYREINLEGSDEKQRTVGEELQADKPAVAVVVGDLAAQMAKWYLEDVPVVYCDSVRAVKMTLTTGKAVGIYHEPGPEDQLKVMRELFPDISRAGLLYSPEYVRLNESEVKSAAADMGLEIEIAPLGSVKEVPVKIRELLPKIEVLWVFIDPVVLSSHSIQYIVLQSITAKVPIFCGDDGLAHGGAVAALVPDLKASGKMAAGEANKVLGGTVPTPGTVMYPSGQLILNQKTASLLQVSFPPALASRAKEIIK